MAHESGRVDRATTAEALAELPRHTWTALRSLRWPGRAFPNVDHVVVGPAGVFLIDTRASEHADGLALELAVAEVAEAALELAHTTTAAVPPEQIRPVLCFEGEEGDEGREPVTGWARDVLVCSVANVVEMLTTRPTVLTTQQVIQVCLDLHGVVLPAVGRKGSRPIAWAARDPWDRAAVQN